MLACKMRCYKKKQITIWTKQSKFLEEKNTDECSWGKNVKIQITENKRNKKCEYVKDQKCTKFMAQNMDENQNQIEESSKRKQQHMINKYTTNSKLVKEQHIKRKRRKNHPETELHVTCKSHQTVYASKKKQERLCSSIVKKCVEQNIENDESNTTANKQLKNNVIIEEWNADNLYTKWTNA